MHRPSVLGVGADFIKGLCINLLIVQVVPVCNTNVRTKEYLDRSTLADGTS